MDRERPERDDDDDRQSGSLMTYDIATRSWRRSPRGARYDVSLNGKVRLPHQGRLLPRRGGAMSAPKPTRRRRRDNHVTWAAGRCASTARRVAADAARAWKLERDFFYDRRCTASTGTASEAVRLARPRMATRTTSRTARRDVRRAERRARYHWPVICAGKPSHRAGGDMKYDAERLLADHRIYKATIRSRHSSPLAARPGRQAGSWIVAIDGKPLSRRGLPARSRTARQEVELSINDAQGRSARRIVVKPVANDTRIRYATWIRDTANTSTGQQGQLGYITVRHGRFGLQQFARDFPRSGTSGPGDRRRWNTALRRAMIVEHLDAMFSSPDALLTLSPDHADRSTRAISTC